MWDFQVSLTALPDLWLGSEEPGNRASSAKFWLIFFLAKVPRHRLRSSGEDGSFWPPQSGHQAAGGAGWNLKLQAGLAGKRGVWLFIFYCMSRALRDKVKRPLRRRSRRWRRGWAHFGLYQYDSWPGDGADRRVVPSWEPRREQGSLSFGIGFE